MCPFAQLVSPAHQPGASPTCGRSHYRSHIQDPSLVRIGRGNYPDLTRVAAAKSTGQKSKQKMGILPKLVTNSQKR